MHPRAEELIASLQLKPHPEGGFYHQVFKSKRVVENRRSAMTAIHFLLPGGELSRWHRVAADEIWVNLEGDGVRLFTFDDESTTSHIVHGHAFHAVAPGTWMAAEPLGDYALLACFVAPGFEYEDFTLMADDEAAAARLRSIAPAFANMI